MYPRTSTIFWRCTFAFFCLVLLAFGSQRLSLPTTPPRKAVHVLCYHDITPITTNRFSRTPQQLAGDFDAILDGDMLVVPLETIILHLQTGKPMPENWVALTFDDATGGQFEFARPLLQQYGFPATFFVPTHSVETGVPVSADYSGVMSWQELIRLKAEGFALASHSHRHRSFARETAAWIEQDISLSLMLLENRLGIISRDLCLPFGEYRPEDEAVFLKMGLRSIALTTTDHGPGLPSLLKIHRFELHADTGQTELLAWIKPQ